MPKINSKSLGEANWNYLDWANIEMQKDAKPIESYFVDIGKRSVRGFYLSHKRRIQGSKDFLHTISSWKCISLIISNRFSLELKQVKKEPTFQPDLIPQTIILGLILYFPNKTINIAEGVAMSINSFLGCSGFVFYFFRALNFSCACIHRRFVWSR